MLKSSFGLPVVAFLAILFVGLAVGPTWGVGVGDVAPSFSLTDIDGSNHTLAGYLRSPVLIMFLTYDDATSISLAPRVQSDFQSRYQSQGLVVLGIETSGCESGDLSSFRYSTGVDFPLLLNGGSTLSAYGLSEGSFVLVDANGIVKYVAEGPGAGAYNPSAMGTAVDNALQDAASTKAKTWGQIKNLYK